MKIIITLLLLSTHTYAANYVSLSSGNTLYDIEVIVFARELPQPNSFEVSNQVELNLKELNVMEAANSDMPLFKSANTIEESTEWQVPLNEKNAHTEALAWFAFDDLPTNNPVYNKIDNHPQLRALFYQKWRQPATPYRNPGYVKISNWPEDMYTPEDEATLEHMTTDFTDDTTTKISKSDYTFRGKIAFSMQKFYHGHINVDLYRMGQDDQLILYNINQSSQINIGQWQYFDHQQFGVLMKVSTMKN